MDSKTDLHLSTPQKVILQASENILSAQTKTLLPEDFQFAQKVREILLNPAPENSTEELIETAKLDARKDSALTDQFKVWIDSSDSALTSERSKLGINTEDEKPFDICIITIRALSADIQKAVWKSLTGAELAFVFKDVYSNGKKKLPTIYMSNYHALSLMNKHRNFEYNSIQLRHEYRHTQRSFNFEPRGILFNLLDEAATSVDDEYLMERVFLEFILLTTDQLSSENFVYAYEKDDDQIKAEILRELQHAFGEKGLLLLGAANPNQSLKASGELPDLPLLPEVETDNTKIHLAETMLALREKADQNWRNTLRARLQKTTHPRETINFWLNPVFKTFCEGIEKTSTPRLQDLIRIIQESLA